MAKVILVAFVIVFVTLPHFASSTEDYKTTCMAEAAQKGGSDLCTPFYQCCEQKCGGQAKVKDKTCKVEIGKIAESATCVCSASAIIRANTLAIGAIVAAAAIFLKRFD